MIEGDPFWKNVFTEINDEKQLQKLAYTLARFLKSCMKFRYLHSKVLCNVIVLICIQK